MVQIAMVTPRDAHTPTPTPTKPTPTPTPTMIATVITATITTETTRKQSWEEQYGLYIGIAIVLVVALVATLVLMQRKPSVKPTPPRPAEQAPTQKFCINCGTSLPADAQFCKKCGSKQT